MREELLGSPHFPQLCSGVRHRCTLLNRALTGQRIHSGRGVAPQPNHHCRRRVSQGLQAGHVCRVGQEVLGHVRYHTCTPGVCIYVGTQQRSLEQTLHAQILGLYGKLQASLDSAVGSSSPWYGPSTSAMGVQASPCASACGMGVGHEQSVQRCFFLSPEASGPKPVVVHQSAAHIGVLQLCGAIWFSRAHKDVEGRVEKRGIQGAVQQGLTTGQRYGEERESHIVSGPQGRRHAEHDGCGRPGTHSCLISRSVMFAQAPASNLEPCLEPDVGGPCLHPV